jgi:hypothetical protein
MSSFFLLSFFAAIFFNQFSSALYLPRQQQNGTLRWVDCTTHVPQPIQMALNITTFSGPLPPTLFCGEMDVPMDYSKPIAADNQITVGFAMNRPKNPAGLLILWVSTCHSKPDSHLSIFLAMQAGPGLMRCLRLGRTHSTHPKLPLSPASKNLIFWVCPSIGLTSGGSPNFIQP